MSNPRTVASSGLFTGAKSCPKEATGNSNNSMTRAFTVGLTPQFSGAGAAAFIQSASNGPASAGRVVRLQTAPRLNDMRVAPVELPTQLQTPAQAALLPKPLGTKARAPNWLATR